MGTMWQINYSRESWSYLADSAPYVLELVRFLFTLSLTDEGLPTDECVEIEPDYYGFEAVGHLIVIHLNREERILTVATLKPLE